MKTVTIIKKPEMENVARGRCGSQGSRFQNTPSGLLQKSLMISRYKKVNGIYTRGLRCL